MPFWKKTDKGGKKTPPKPAIPHTAQQSIPMQRMFEDGTCRVRANYYTRTILQLSAPVFAESCLHRHSSCGRFADL